MVHPGWSSAIDPVQGAEDLLDRGGLGRILDCEVLQEHGHLNSDLAHGVLSFSRPSLVALARVFSKGRQSRFRDKTEETEENPRTLREMTSTDPRAQGLQRSTFTMSQQS